MSFVLKDGVRRLSRNRLNRWLWVPAFAGTTNRASRIRFSNGRQIYTHVRDLAASVTRVLLQITSLPDQRAQGMPGDRCARSLVCEMKKHTSLSHHGHTGFTRHSPRNGFNGFLRALSGDRAFLSPSPAICATHIRRLDASVEASRPHDFAVRFMRDSSKAPKRPPHPALHVRDDCDTPLIARRDGGNQ